MSWASRNQSTISLFSIESEYTALRESICELKWIQNLLNEIGCKCKTPMTIYGDSQSTIKVAEESRSLKDETYEAIFI